VIVLLDDVGFGASSAFGVPCRTPTAERLATGGLRYNRYNVLPMHDRTAERLHPDMAGRPTLIRSNSQLFFPGMGRLSENSVVSVKNKSFSDTAEVTVANGGAEGAIIAQRGRFGGWAVYAKAGAPSSPTTCWASRTS
jgi:hypothetical protein